MIPPHHYTSTNNSIHPSLMPFLSCRQSYDAFLVVHGTDTMAYTASALSLMLAGEA